VSEDADTPSKDDVFIERVAKLFMGYKKAIQMLLEKAVPESEWPRIAELLEAQAKTEDMRGFRVTMWDEIAFIVRAEIGYRHTLNRARESGLECYCCTCDGECKGDEEHEKRARKFAPGELDLNEMSREALIQEVLKARSKA
jgi:hypothetical protein